MTTGKIYQLITGPLSRFSISRFAASSVVATAVDYLAYVLISRLIAPETANLISQSMGLVVNFTLQRMFVFPGSRRSVKASFVISFSLSLVGILLATGIIFLIRLLDDELVLLPKITATCLVFFYNYFSKKHLAFPADNNTGDQSGSGAAEPGLTREEP
ncbi:MAG: GtrA family protein [Deltaproteobacteria bacterium]|nr:GtrA family protein [Deltaproteobacteria bacterium]